ncbi:hypothetical protein AGMMS49525_04860 [Bacteroidia bacterium]|nr:hypothetical protein AGMMS49525_04860 [Bacteroidia bacterium]
MNANLEKIAKKYEAIDFSRENYEVGGGLDVCKFASRRHEDALNDSGKLTQGKFAAMIKKAIDGDVSEINRLIDYHFPNLEWHHAGKLPKQYGGGMKKTYFLNAAQIVDFCRKFDTISANYEAHVANLKREFEEKKTLEQRRTEFLKENGEKKVRVGSNNRGEWFIELDREMNGKYGWFSSYGKSYNMTEYYTGYSFKSEEIYKKYLELI